MAVNKKPTLKHEIKEEPSQRVPETNGATEEKAASNAATKGATAAGSAAPAPTMLAPPNANWNPEQQIALENAMRKFPAMQFSANPAERWEKIAGEVPGKNKKEVKQRVKVHSWARGMVSVNC